MGHAEYTLTGFDDFLERRRITFVEPLPSVRLCSVCRLVTPRLLLLPCCHVVCAFCKGNSLKPDECPIDCNRYVETDALSLEFKQSQLDQLSVRCLNARQGCSFTGKLCQLREHLLDCGSDEVNCARCEHRSTRSAIREHYRSCSGETFLFGAVSEAEVQGVVESFEEMKKRLLKMRGRASGDQTSTDAMLNSVNAIAEHVSCLEAQLCHVKQNANGQRSRRAILSSVRCDSGPYRAPSRRGVFISLCKIDGARGPPTTYDQMIQKKSDPFTLGGYNCQLQYYCRNVYDKEKSAITFTLFLLPGEWDNSVEWPFVKNVELIVTHLRDQEKDVRVQMNPPADPNKAAAGKPGHGLSNPGFSFVPVPLKQIIMENFWNNGSLYVNVEME